MKNKLFILMLFLPGISFAGTLTTLFGSGGGTVTLSSGSYVPNVVYDASASTAPLAGSSPLNFNITIGSGNNRIILVGCGQVSSDNIASITVGGSAMTLVSSGTVSIYSSNIFYKKAPASGVQTISVGTGSGVTQRTACAAISYSEVNQTTPIDVSSTTENYVVNAASAAVSLTTTGSNEGLFDFMMNGNFGTPVPAIPQNPILATGWQGSYEVASSSMAASTAGTYTLGWGSIAGSTPHANTAVAVNPSLTP